MLTLIKNLLGATIFLLAVSNSAFAGFPPPNPFSNTLPLLTTNNRLCFLGDSLTAATVTGDLITGKVTGGTSPYTLGTETGVPSGATVGISGANLYFSSFTAAPGTYNMTIQVNDSASNSGTFSVTAVVSNNYTVTSLTGGGTSGVLTYTVPSIYVYTWNDYGPAFWVQSLTNNAIYSDRTLQFGLPGDTSTGLLNRLSIPLSANCGGYQVLIGTNDLGSRTASQIEANITSIINQLLATGKPVILGVIYTRNLTTQSTLDELWTVDRWINSLRGTRQGLYIYDPNSYYGNPSVTTGYPISAATYDGLHNNGYGGQLLYYYGELPLLNSIFPNDAGYQNTGTSASDLYDSTNTSGSLDSNPLLTGTTGTDGGNATGTFPTSWSGTLFDGYGCTSCTMSVAGSQGTFSDGTPAQVLTVSGSGSTDYEATTFLAQNITSYSNFSASDKLQLSCRFQISSGSQNIDYPYIQLQYIVNGVTINQTAGEESSSNGNTIINGGNTGGNNGLAIPEETLSTPYPQNTLGGVPTFMQIQAGVALADPSSNSTFSGTVKIGFCSLRKVQ